MTNYNPGQDITLTGVFKNSSGTATDPTAAALLVIRADDDIQTYLSAAGWALQGNWNASTNTPALADGTGTAGHYYTVTVAGSVNFGVKSITFEVGDRVYYDGDYWLRLTNIQTGTLTHGAVGTFSYDYPAPPIYGDYKYTFLGVGAIKGVGTPTAFTVAESEIWAQ